jgi:hypothetical protein
MVTCPTPSLDLDSCDKAADAFRAIMLDFIVATLLVPLLRNVAASPAWASASH